jgi:hypothetical protein
MVRLVDDDEIESVAERFHVMKRARKGRYRHGFQRSLSISVLSDRTCVVFFQDITPLLQDHSGWSQAQRPTPAPSHRSHCQQGLSGTGWQDDQPPSAGELPRRKCGGLIWPKSTAFQSPGGGSLALRTRSWNDRPDRINAFLMSS